MAAFPGPRGVEHARVMQLAGQDTRKALDAARVKHGDAFVFGFGSIRYHWFLNIDGAHLLLRDRPDAFANRGAYGFLEPVGGRAALINSDDPEHLRRRRAVQPAFHARLTSDWTTLAESHFAELIEDLLAHASHAPTPILPRVRATMLNVVVDLLLGAHVRERQPQLTQDVGTMMDYANRPPLEQLVKVRVPGHPWLAFTQARARADAAIRQEIRLRRAGAIANTGGVLDALLAHDNDATKRLSEDELRDQALSLISAGFDTTTAAITWTLYLLTQPELMEACRGELLASNPPASLEGAPWCHAVVNEALRLYPPAPAILRRVREPVTYQGATLKTGSGAALSVYHLHRDSTLWRDPLRVEPRRWLDGFDAWRAPRDPLSFIPFGHGGRFCIGGGMARTMVFAFVNAAVKRASWQLAHGDEPLPIGTTLVPHNGLPLRWQSASRA